jgi:hypothetical protein
MAHKDWVWRIGIKFVLLAVLKISTLRSFDNFFLSEDKEKNLT